MNLKTRLRRSFALHFDGPPFRLFGPSHWAVLLILAGLVAGLWWVRAWPEPARLALRWAAALAVVVNELTMHAWYARHKRWTAQELLPLHLCSFMIWTTPVMLVTGSYVLYEYLYFLGVGFASQALLTPDLGEHDYPHFRYFNTNIAHGLIVWAALYMTVVEGYRPTLDSLWRVVVGMNVLMLIVGLINWRLGSNYMFLARKPATPSLIDKLGPWPWYILALEGLGLVMCGLLYLPFALSGG